MSNRTFLISITLPLLMAPPVAASSGRLCFTRGDYIFIQEPNGRVKRLIKGSEPNLSPDGESIAFVAVKGEWPPDRHVNVFDIRTGKVRSISTLEPFQSFGPLWSPDGRRLAVQMSVNHKTAFATVDARTDDYCLIPSNFESNYVWLNSWIPDGNSVILNSLEYVYQLTLDGQVVRKLGIRELFGNVNISSLTRFSFSRDGRFLLFDSAMVPDDVGIASLYLWDISAQRLSRLTSDPIGALDPKWLPSGNEIIFTGYVKGHYKPKSCIPYYRLYKISMTDKTPIILVRDAEDASYSTR